MINNTSKKQLNTQYWLLKSEPDTYSIDDLCRERQTIWTGIRNYQARNFMRDMMKKGDLCLFYHSGKEKSIVGVAKVASSAYPDPTQFDARNYSYDPKSTQKDPIWFLVDIGFQSKLKEPISLAEIKNDPEFMGMMLTRATRLSIQPVSEKHFLALVR